MIEIILFPIFLFFLLSVNSLKNVLTTGLLITIKMCTSCDFSMAQAFSFEFKWYHNCNC